MIRCRAMQTEVLLDGLRFPEGPRWRDGRLVFSDMHDHKVIAVDPTGRAETLVETPGACSGLVSVTVSSASLAGGR